MTCRTRRALNTTLFSALLLVGGCGKSVPAVQLAPVSGQVKLDGKPLAGATVIFHPEAGDAASVDSSGTTDEQGNYKLKTFDGREGAVVGKHKVSVNLIDRERKKGMNAVPEKYNIKSILTFTVPAEGSKDANFAISK